MGKGIPDRWLNYKPIGERVPGTRFIAFKVPLHQHVNAKVEEKLRLAPESLLESVPELGLIIDLTNTNRYYHPSALTDHDVRHQKLMIPGKQTPPRELAEKFCGFVADFLKSNADNDKLIGVHCTHGVNRTGYLICYFMISVMKKSPEEAIKNFSAARGHEIERGNYLTSLKKLPDQGSKKERSLSKESSSEDDYEEHGYTSRRRNDYENDRQQKSHYQRSGGYYQKHNYRGQNYGNPAYNNWRNGNQGHYSSDRYHSRDNRWNHQNHQNYYESSRGHVTNWRDSGRMYSKPNYHHNGDWSYSRNYRQNQDYRQDNRWQDNRSAGGYYQNSRGYQQNHYKTYQRDDSRRTSRRHYSDED